MDIVQNNLSVNGPMTPPRNLPPGDFFYGSDSFGRPVQAEGRVPGNPAVRNRGAQKAVSGAFNALEKRMIDASHLIARTFGGSGNQYNLVPAPREFNQDLIRAFELKLAQRLDTEDYYLQVFARYVGGANSQKIPAQLVFRAFKIVQGKPSGMPELEQTFSILH